MTPFQIMICAALIAVAAVVIVLALANVI